MFENRYYSNDKMIREYIIKIICKKLIIMGCIISVVGILLCITVALDQDILKFGVFLTATFIVIITTALTPFITLKDYKRNEIALNGGKKHETFVLFDDKISLSEGTFKIEVEYNQINAIHILKNSCVLMFGKTNGIMIEQNSFTKGTFEGLLLFLKQKCKQVKTA